MPALDTEKVWTALMGDPAFVAEIPQNAHEAFRSVVDGLPAAFASLLDRKVDFTAFMEAKSAVLELMLATDFIERMFASIDAEMLPFPVATMSKMAGEATEMMRDAVAEMLQDPQAFLAQSGVTERQMLAHPKGGRFDARTLAAYDAGKLTIRSLLETQPATLLLNAQ